MKTDLQGNVIWSKLNDSTVHADYDFMNYFRLLELKDGSILLAGRTTKKISNNNDFVLTKLDNTGNIIWLKTYESKCFQAGPKKTCAQIHEIVSMRWEPATNSIHANSRRFLFTCLIVFFQRRQYFFSSSNSYTLVLFYKLVCYKML